MPYTLCVAAILTKEQYKTLRSIGNTERDAQLELAIPAAEQMVVDYIDRDLTTDPVAETRTFRYEPGSVIVNIDDCTSVGVVKISNRDLTAGWDYELGRAPAEPVISWLEVDPQIGYRVDPLYEVTHVVGNVARRPFLNIEVTATFGWNESDIPASARQATIWLVDEIVSASTEETGKAAESIADVSYVFRGEENPNAPAVLPPRVAQILTPLRRVSL